MGDLHSSVPRVLENLRKKYPEAKFLCLGQTIWWDEPMKAALRQMLDELGAGGTMILGVHDTDYFAKTHIRQPGESRFELLPHNDGTTRDLWSAAGEISRLFGSETFPTRHDFQRSHVPFERAAAASSEGAQAFLDTVTEAYGWRGLVYTGSRDLIVHSLPLRDMADAVDAMLAWGFDGTRESVVDNCCREEARQLAERLREWAADCAQSNDPQTLSNLYRQLLPRLYELLLGRKPANVEVDCTAHLLRLTPETAGLPRFRFVDLFLNEKTRAIAADSYNRAVADSEIYTLDRFGLGALPFDLVLPEHGRGTLRVTLRAVHVETRDPIRIPLRRPVNSVADLAAILAREFGDHVTLVGKAVALVSMLAREFIFVFNEEGSAYVSRTRKMNDTLRQAGLDVFAHPILRMRYRTWDGLECAGATLSLPDHLASSFGQRQIPSADFASRWSGVVSEQSELLAELERTDSPRSMLAWLEAREGGDWAERRREYEESSAELCALRRQGFAIQSVVNSRYDELRAAKSEIVATERRRGEHYRATSQWTAEETRVREESGGRLAELLARRRALLAEISALKASRLEIERGPEARAVRERRLAVENEIAAARIRLVRAAILTCKGLTHTNHRPAAWWLPMIDPSGRWFDRVARTAEVYLQPLLSTETVAV